VSYKVEISKSASKQLKKLSSELQERIQAKIDDLVSEPRPNAGLFHSFKSGFCQEYQPENLVSW
jgi:mRNA-degrading endonuclease RelE of RelBE toxin-antitoxin system